MKALSIRQPWAWGIIYAGKDCENRSWTTAFRGTFAVHASAQSDGEWKLPRGAPNPGPSEDWIKGAIVGFVDLVEVVPKHRSKWYQPGKFAFVLANPRPLRAPVQCKGRLGFWEVPPHALRRCRQ